MEVITPHKPNIVETLCNNKEIPYEEETLHISNNLI